jgi:hypothetical protein
MNQNVINSNQMNYYNQSQAQTQIAHRQNHNVDHILFVADLPDEACEEDLCNFFKSYNFNFAKVFRYVIGTYTNILKNNYLYLAMS